MGKTMKKLICLLSICGLFIASLTGCFNPSFYNIMEDVPPESATMNGIIRSIARYNAGGTEYLLTAANDGLRYKEAADDSHGKWKVIKLPFELHYFDYYYVNPDKTTGAHQGENILKVVADSTNIYIISVKYANNPDTGHVDPVEAIIRTTSASDLSAITADDWTIVDIDRDGEDKTLLQFYSVNDYVYSRFNLFSTNAVQNANRKVFVRSGSSEDTLYYQLSGGSISKISTPVAIGSDSTAEINGAAYIDGSVKFFASAAVCSNETESKPASMVYFGKPSDSKLYYYDGTTVKEGVNCGVAPLSIAVTADSIIVGRGNIASTSTVSNGGVVKIECNQIETAVPATELAKFSTNAEIQLSSSYFIFTLLAVNPDLPEVETSMYSSIGFKGSGTSTSVTYDSVGLWSYYKTRGNWNRE